MFSTESLLPLFLFMVNHPNIKEPILVQWMQLVNDQYQEFVVKSLIGARNAFLEIRLHMREMGKAAGVPVSLFCSKSHYGFCSGQIF